MKTSIITRLCVLAASLCLFASVTGCLEMTPFPEASSAYTLEYHQSLVDRELSITFSPETEIYNFIDNMSNFSGSIDKCELHYYDDGGVATGLVIDSGDCSQMDSAAARNGDPITIVFSGMSIGDVESCSGHCKAKVVLGVTVSGTIEGQDPFADVVLNDEVATYEAPHFNPQILNNEPQFLDLETADVVGNCTGDHEMWDSAISMCVCDDGYELELGLSMLRCVAEAGADPDPDPDPNEDPDPEVTDTDGDGVLDVDDNCPEIVNPQQFDVDNDGVGNVCDVNTTSGQASEADQWGGGSCSLNPSTTSTTGFDILPWLMAVSLIAVRRRFRKQ